ncbi:hypothetical protein [Streptomyces nitrosporeus]|uniref:hypothetical protein n=1 Tax=Streptomyces nitrosporeus TaxID=28894 RepID=UPI00167D0337|nr:hypothetical protein [Streptomyces nitrosporeus]GGZ29764.1 hypothetical protein GCM10010327_70030 [Streptomyces nitrosporeus]
MTTAEKSYDSALNELHRQEVAAVLRSRKGLHYASIGDDRRGPNLVAFNGKILGETYTKSPGLTHDWYSVTLKGEEKGPFITARAAAASLKNQ